jgi:hypothetical protein
MLFHARCCGKRTADPHWPTHGPTTAWHDVLQRLLRVLARHARRSQSGPLRCPPVSLPFSPPRHHPLTANTLCTHPTHTSPLDESACWHGWAQDQRQCEVSPRSVPSTLPYCPLARFPCLRRRCVSLWPASSPTVNAHKIRLRANRAFLCVKATRVSCATTSSTTIGTWPLMNRSECLLAEESECESAEQIRTLYINVNSGHSFSMLRVR